ncbi:hypothetical protein C8J55DRAFT_491261 [Lentinula edodes]|uniref:Uncharacterized protein n=1 Tax=Lentinula lateritia TaxID=40482 RepID=A0A9W9A0T7_9AGAR|nr:hypothetical protein C8J55DRAFT_491261 [Lentinula edodes]
MRLNFAYLTTIALVSFAYAAPVVRRKHGPLPVKNVTVVYDPNDEVLIVGASDTETRLIEAINKYIKDAMASKWEQAPKESFYFEKEANKDENSWGTAKFSVEVVEEEKEGKPPKTKTYKGGELIYNATPVRLLKPPH